MKMRLILFLFCFNHFHIQTTLAQVSFLKMCYKKGTNQLKRLLIHPQKNTKGLNKAAKKHIDTLNKQFVKSPKKYFPFKKYDHFHVDLSKQLTAPLSDLAYRRLDSLISKIDAFVSTGYSSLLKCWVKNSVIVTEVGEKTIKTKLYLKAEDIGISTQGVFPNIAKANYPTENIIKEKFNEKILSNIDFRGLNVDRASFHFDQTLGLPRSGGVGSVLINLTIVI